jgi:uncharacterized protein involved in exopolysaccharide biosynthesis
MKNKNKAYIKNSSLILLTFCSIFYSRIVLELISKTYIDYSLEERLADVQLGIDFVDDQLLLVQERAEKLQHQLQSFRQQYNLQQIPNKPTTRFFVKAQLRGAFTKNFGLV